MKIGDRVVTIDGFGIIIEYDLPHSKKSKRYVVELDKKKYSFNPCYFKKDLKMEV